VTGAEAAPLQSLRILGALAALGSAASWALGSVLFKQLGEELEPVVLTATKGIAGAAMLGLVLRLFTFQPVSSAALVLLVLSGLLGIAAGDTLFFMALNRLGAQAVVLLLTLGQVLTVLLAVIWLGERPDLMAWAGIVLVTAGVMMVMWPRLRGEAGHSELVGVLLGLAAVGCMAVATVIAKQAMDAGSNSAQATLVRMLAGTAGAVLLGAAMGQRMSSLRPLFGARFAGFFLLSVAVVTFGGFWLSLFAINNAGVAVANTLGSLEPVLVLPVAAVLLKERVTPKVLAGSCAATIGAVLLAAPW
jgi:drug/metabolite transporter (DMT)-like permease